MAPVTGRIPDRDKQRLVQVPGPRERLFAPRQPVHWVVLVLEEGGRGLARQAICHELEATPPCCAEYASPCDRPLTTRRRSFVSAARACNCFRRPRRCRPLRPCGPDRRTAVLLWSDPARPSHRGARRWRC